MLGFTVDQQLELGSVALYSLEIRLVAVGSPETAVTNLGPDPHHRSEVAILLEYVVYRSHLRFRLYLFISPPITCLK